jgi:LysM repeat protein
VPAAPVGEAKVHVVAKGDSFSSMAKKYGVGTKGIEAANPGVDSSKLKIGQKVNIPAPAPKAAKADGAKSGATGSSDSNGTYTVKSGDNLGNIAKRNGTTVAKLREANGLKTDQIKVGQKLKVPAGSAKKSSEPSGATPAPKGDAVPALPPALPSPALPSLGDPVLSPAPKAPGQL